eukprot:TRINITY_DN8656_c0_g5_i2.p1 TRINITY_DN8656_c0_g5~~TRINITY_DN8656_c0_g5_i2.p1  ORF type:complete len:370 (+),score=106.77 TRINITY_DN8656_c0_g5_i2:313-1422(+)
MAEQAQTFAEDLEEEVLEPFGILLREQDSLTDGYNAKYKELERKIKKQMEGLNESKRAYEQALRRAEDLLYECEKCRKDEDMASISKLNPKMSAALKEHADAVEMYKAAPEKTKSEQEQYATVAAAIMEAFKQQEVTRTEFAKTSLKKMLEYERARTAVRKQDADRTAGIIERIRSKSDIQKLLDLPQLSDPQLSFKVDAAKSGWDKLFDLYREVYYESSPKLLDYVALVEETKQQILQSNDPEYKACKEELDKLCRELLKPQYGSFTKLVDAFKVQTKERKGRVAFIESLKGAIEARGNANVTDREARPIKEVFNNFISLVRDFVNDRVIMRRSIGECMSVRRSQIHWCCPPILPRTFFQLPLRPMKP